jgi:kelch-like protein 7
LTIDEAILLVEVSNRFWMISLKNLCIQYLKENLDALNCFDVLYTAGNYNVTNLYNFCLRFIENNFEFAVKTEPFLQIDPSLLMEIVLSDNLVMSREERFQEPKSKLTMQSFRSSYVMGSG